MSKLGTSDAGFHSRKNKIHVPSDFTRTLPASKNEEYASFLCLREFTPKDSSVKPFLPLVRALSKLTWPSECLKQRPREYSKYSNQLSFFHIELVILLQPPTHPDPQKTLKRNLDRQTGIVY